MRALTLNTAYHNVIHTVFVCDTRVNTFMHRHHGTAQSGGFQGLSQGFPGQCRRPHSLSVNVRSVKGLELKAGQLIDLRYRVVCLLGRGGMGAVYLAVDVQTNHQIALKVMRIDPDSPDLAGRFLRGARLSRRVRHPHVIPTASMGQWGDPIQGHYMVMQYFDALSLRDILDVGLPPGAVCTLMSQVLSALAHIHALGVLHRDIKPDNIMVSRLSDGTLHTKLTDFGIAASLSQDMNVTEDGSGIMVGTPAYMAPEQVQQLSLIHISEPTRPY